MTIIPFIFEKVSDFDSIEKVTKEDPISAISRKLIDQFLELEVVP